MLNHGLSGVRCIYNLVFDKNPLQTQRPYSASKLVSELMILVDDAGKAFPSINHAPWFEVTLADFVMPFFLFGVGVSVSLVFKNVSDRLAATKKVVLRSVKLFMLGVLLQGGYFHGRDNLTYGVDVTKIRVMVVLQDCNWISSGLSVTTIIDAMAILNWSLVLLICVAKVVKSAFDKALSEHEDIDDDVGSKEPTERDHGVDLQQPLLITIDSSDSHKK
ncbi:hypothetical protein OROMI_006315 [Orobanche minor]